MRFVINVDYAEACTLSLSPLEIIGKRPVIITLDAVVGFADSFKLIVDKARAEGVSVIARAVLCDEYGVLSAVFCRELV